MRIMTNAMRRTAGALAIAQLWVGLACRGDDGHAGGDGSGSSGTSADTTVASASASSDSGGVGDDATVIEASLPTALACGESVTATIRVRNDGATTWSADDGYALGAVDDTDPLSAVGRIPLPAGASIEPGSSHTFELTLTAPAGAGAVMTDWRMVHEHVQWFGETAAAAVTIACDGTGERGGPVVLEERSFADDGGRFVALGATMMWAAWAYRNDRPRLESDLAYLQANGFHYVRALGVVGDPAAPDYWDGREIELAWPDYAEVVAGLSALAFDEYGLRVEWTFIGDGQITVPSAAARDALTDVFVALAQDRPDAIMHFELANEAWQNGFAGDDGLAELRARTLALRDRTAVVVAASAPFSDGCDDVAGVYGGDVADLATIHVDRNLGGPAGAWGPVLRPWIIDECGALPPASNNEPIGPGASVASEDDPERLVAAALATWLAGWPAYVFHSNAGVRGFDPIAGAVGGDRFAPIVATLPGDLASWTRRRHDDGGAALRIYATVGGIDVPDVTWPEAGGEAGVAGLLQSEQGERVLALALGIVGDAALEARVPLSLEIVDILTAEVVESRELAAGEGFSLTGAGARLLRATRR